MELLVQETICATTLMSFLLQDGWNLLGDGTQTFIEALL